MGPRGSPLGELWAWLAGLLLPAAGLVAALSMTLSDDAAPTEPPTAGTATTLVAGASLSQSSPPIVAPTATPRESIGGPLLASPMLPTGPAPQPVTNAGPDVAVAGMLVQAQVPIPADTAPLIGRVGGHAVPTALPAAALVLMVAGFGWRVHTSASWPSKNALPPPPRSRRTRSALA